jgi:hypothetical protein
MTNNGGGILAGTVTLTDPDNVFSSLQEGQTYSLARNETLEIEVQYQPSGGVTNTGSINLAAPCGPVILSGNGIDAQCGLTASSLDFGSVRILESSMLPVTITNTGGGNLTGTVTLTDPDNVFSSPQEGQPYSLGYNQSLVVQVTYAPLDAVVSNGVVNLGLPCGGVDLAGVGIGPLCSLTDTQIDMGTIWVQSPMDTTVTMRNIGGGILIGQITLDDPAGVFHCTPTDTLVALAYQESIQIQIRFDPRDLGQYGATLDFGTACGAVSLAGAGDGATIPVFDTAPLVLPDTDLGEVIQQVIPLENAGNIPIHAFIGFSDPSAVFNCTSELDSVLVPSQVAGVPGRIELIVSFTPEFTTGTYQAVLSPCADCGSKVITATATYPFTGEEPVTPGDTLVGGNASSNGDFWQVYPDPDFGGLAPESVYQIDFQGGLLTLEMTSPDQVGLAVLSDQTPDSLLAVAECINGVCTLDRHLPAGAYYLVVDGTDLEYTFEMQVSATNPKLQAAGAFRFGRNTTASVSNDTLSYWNPGDYGNFPGMGGRGPEVAYKLEMTDTLDIELTMHAGFTSTLGMALIKGSPLEGDSYVSPDSCLAIGVPVGDSLRLVRPGLLPGMYFLVLDCDSADYSFTLSAANPNLLDPPGLGIGKQIRGRSLDVGHGNFWGPGDYGDSLSVGRGNEVVYEISMTDTLDVVLRTESSNVNSLGMVLLMGQSPDSVLAAAEPQGDRWVIRRRLEPGNYLLVVDSDSIDYRYTISWVNPNLLSALPFPLDLVLPDSSGRSHGDFWGPEEGETFGPGREVAFRIEQVQDLDLVVHSEQIMHVTLLDDLAPDAVVIATDRIRVGDDWYTNYSVLDSTRVYFVVVDSDSTNFLFTIALRTTGIRQFELPSEFTLLGNYPNPFNPATSIRWTLPSEGVTRLEIFNMLGQKVEDFRFGALPAGLHLFRWDASHLASGAYVYRLHWNRQVQTDKLLLLK